MNRILQCCLIASLTWVPTGMSISNSMNESLLIHIENHLHMNAKFNSLASLKDIKALSVEQAANVKGGALLTDEDKRRSSLLTVSVGSTTLSV